jgi:hypothetical protein
MLRFSIELRPEMHVSLNLHQAAEEERDRGLMSGSHEQALLRDLLASRLAKSLLLAVLELQRKDQKHASRNTSA